MTWSVDAAAALEHDEQLRSAVRHLLQDFLQRLDTDADLAEQLPGYRADLPYYRRLFASGLSASLRESMRAEDGARRSARERLFAGSAGLQRRLRA